MVFEPYLHLRITPEGSKKSKMTPKLSFKSKSKVEIEGTIENRIGSTTFGIWHWKFED